MWAWQVDSFVCVKHGLGCQALSISSCSSVVDQSGCHCIWSGFIAFGLFIITLEVVSLHLQLVGLHLEWFH